MRTHFRLTHAAILLIALAAVAAAAQPNFSGTWKLNLAKSTFGEMPAPSSIVATIKHEEPNFQMAVQQSSDMGDMNYDVKYTTDGKECTNTIFDGPTVGVVKWDGEALTVATKGKFGDSDFTMNDRITLSEDGKVMTVLRHFSSGFGEGDQKMVFEKQ